MTGRIYKKTENDPTFLTNQTYIHNTHFHDAKFKDPTSRRTARINKGLKSLSWERETIIQKEKKGRLEAGYSHKAKNPNVVNKKMSLNSRTA